MGNNYVDAFINLKCSGSVLETCGYLGSKSTKEIAEAMGIIKQLKKILLYNSQEFQLVDLCSGNGLVPILSIHLFKNLINLKELNLRHNKFTDIPYWLGDLKNLRTLNLMSNKFLSKIPESIGNLTSLRKLDLWGTWISALPKSIYKLKNLKELNLRYTRVTVIPDSIGDLSSLEYLCCDPSITWQDCVIKIPKSILNCNSLKTLDLNRKSIEESPLIIEELRKRGVKVVHYY